jgi:hypothetical protein
MSKITKKKVALIGGTAALVAIGGGAAFAYWSTSGSGTGTATTSAGASSLVVTQTSAPTNLAPGVAAGAIAGNVKNNASNNAYVASVTVSIQSVTQGLGATGTCDETDYNLSNATMTVNQDVAPGATVNFSGATLGFKNKPDALQDGCKGATVNLAYSTN